MGARDTECQKNGNHRDTENESRSTFTRHHSLPWVYSLVLHIFHQPLGTDFGSVNISRRIGSDALRGACAGFLICRIWNERGDRAVLRAADPDAAFPAIVVPSHRLGFRIRDVDDIVSVNIDSARAAELRPLVEEFAVLIENLDAIILPIADEQPPLRIDGDRVGNIEFSRSRTLLAPGLDELAVL